MSPCEALSNVNPLALHPMHPQTPPSSKRPKNFPLSIPARPHRWSSPPESWSTSRSVMCRSSISPMIRSPTSRWSFCLPYTRACMGA